MGTPTKRWSEYEVQRLLELHDGQREGFKVIGEVLGRSESGCRRKYNEIKNVKSKKTTRSEEANQGLFQSEE